MNKIITFGHDARVRIRKEDLTEAAWNQVLEDISTGSPSEETGTYRNIVKSGIISLSWETYQ